MARGRLRQGIVTGLQTILGNLAKFFRLGTTAAVPQEQEAEPGRQRLRTPQEIISTLSARHELPSEQQGVRRSYSYVATWTDTATGERIGATRVQVESDPSVPRSTIDSRARAEATLQLPRYVSTSLIEQSRVRMSIRRISVVDLPPQP